MVATAIWEIASGDVQYGVFCLVGVLITLLPAIHARRLDARVPLELELALLWLMLADMTLGNGLDLYHRFTWFDKILHFSSSILVALIGFLVIYVLHLTQRTRFRPWIDGAMILLVTLGLGALWEIAEYTVDQLFGRATQGAPNLSALDDTMVDLILDGIGGVIGALLGPLYIKHSKRSRRAAEHFAELLSVRGERRRARGRTTTSSPRSPAHSTP
jgi:hypothetical protein